MCGRRVEESRVGSERERKTERERKEQGMFVKPAGKKETIA